MGQCIGRAPLLPEALAFLNLPRSSILELWEAFNDIAEGEGRLIPCPNELQTEKQNFGSHVAYLTFAYKSQVLALL